MNAKHFSIAFAATLTLVGCGIDTTGLSPESVKPPHPRSNSGAAVLVEEFIDLQCEACRAAQTRIVKPMLDRYGSMIRYEVKFFPIFPGHRYSISAAEAAECAADQGKFWEFEEMNYENQDDLGPTAVIEWGEAIGLDIELFKRCILSGIKRDTVLTQQAEGTDRGVEGTPTFFVNGAKVESTIDAIGTAIMQAASGSVLQ
jgi:protein-disulfide isomerase